MVEMKLLDCSGGWSFSKTPDNLLVEIQLERTTHEFYLSLCELMELYARVREREWGEFFVGTGTRVTVTPASKVAETIADDYIRLQISPLEFEAPQEELQSALESVLADSFRKHDEKDPSGRIGHLEKINLVLEHIEVEPRAIEYYETLIDK